MIRALKFTTMCLCIILLSSHAEAASAVREKITFLEEDGRHCLLFKTERGDAPGIRFLSPKAENATVEDFLKQYYYFYPNEHSWDDSSDPQHNIFRIKDGSYANLQRIDLSDKERLVVGEDGIFTFTNWDRKTKVSGRHYGDWVSPNAFSQYTYVWVFPEKFEILEYKCNRTGKWVKRHNTIAYYGKNVNNLVFTIKYRPKSQKTYEVLSKALKGQEQVQVSLQTEGVKITLGSTMLFPSGSVELTEDGQSLLSEVIEALQKKESASIIIEGHTDNIKIKSKKSRLYPTNWELSAARSLTVLHYLVENGISESRLESRAFGFQRPIASNKTAKGRAKNRRIELLIREP